MRHLLLLPFVMDELNVLGAELQACSFDPLAGFYRDGCCRTDASDRGSHVICARVTADFLAFSMTRGNDLITPRREWMFPGLGPGDKWCLCAARWQQAFLEGVAPKVILESCHERALEYCDLSDLIAYSHQV